MKRSIHIVILLLVSVFSGYAARERTFSELSTASDWISSNRLQLIITNEEVNNFPNSEMLTHLTDDKSAIRDSFNKYVKGEEIKRAYIQASIQEIYKVMSVGNKSMVPSISEDALINSVNEPLGKNFDKLLISIIGIKWLPDTIELTITIEGKNLVYPLVLNILEIQQDTLEPVLYISNSLDDMNAMSIGKTNIKLIYKLENGSWVMDNQNFLKLLNGMVFVKYYNKNIDISRKEILEKMICYVEKIEQENKRPHSFLMHTHGLFHGVRGSKYWKREINHPSANSETLKKLIQLI